MKELLSYNFEYAPPFLHITITQKERPLSDDILIISYVLFLSRYFYICDARQISIMMNVVRSMMGNESAGRDDFLQKVYRSIFETLNEKEKDAVTKLGPSFYLLGYLQVPTPEKTYAKYKLVIAENKGHIGHLFHLSFGPDIIFLPLTVPIFYAFITDMLKDKHKKDKLDKCILDLLVAYNLIDYKTSNDSCCRSLEGLHVLPIKILKQNHINLE